MATRNQINPPPLRKITDFKSKLTGGGARPNLFEVVLSFPTAAPADNVTLDKARFLVKTAALPASNVSPIDVPFRGRILKIAGDRTFDTWTITVLNDVDFKIRTSFEQWMNGISRISDASGTTNPTVYQQDATVSQLNRQGDAVRKYKFYGIFPTNISQIDLSMDSTDTIEEYTVEFQVQYWEALNTDTDRPAIT